VIRTRRAPFRIALRVEVVVAKVRKKISLSSLPKNGLFYWAYGSNLCEKHMLRRCPGAIKVKALALSNGELVFRGVADCVYRDEDEELIHGGLWYITKTHENILDGVEGVRSRFYLKRYLKLLVQGEPTPALYYQLKMNVGIMPPHPDYLDTIAKGYRDFELPMSALEKALEKSWAHKEITPVLRERQLRRGGRFAKVMDLHVDWEN
jgi:hypothetical protein